MNSLPAVDEEPTRFACAGETLVGVLAGADDGAQLGVVIIVGGPQYRVGSHRQFVLLARELAGAGFPTLRFDYRGMGDSSGDPRNFEDVGDDIRAAVDHLLARQPQLRGVVLWGLCDAATAAMIYAPTDPRVAGLALANPWARSTDTYAKAQLKHYYLQRLATAAFWRKLLSGRFNPLRSARELAGSIGDATQRRAGQDYRERMLEGLARFDGRVLWLISGRDLTAQEFLGFLEQRDAAGHLRSAGARRVDFAAADHSFAHPDWRALVARATVAWLQELTRGKAGGVDGNSLNFQQTLD